MQSELFTEEEFQTVLDHLPEDIINIKESKYDIREIGQTRFINGRMLLDVICTDGEHRIVYSNGGN